MNEFDGLLNDLSPDKRELLKLLIEENEKDGKSPKLRVYPRDRE